MSRKAVVVLMGTVAVVLVALTARLLLLAHLAEQEKRERVALLRGSVAEWNSWRNQHPGIAVDLSEVDLSRADLGWADLHAVDLSAAQLADANLDGANLSGASLRGANLRSTDLERADLTDADLTRADLTGAALYQATLRRTILTDANLFELTRMSVHLQVFEDVDLSQARNVPAGFPSAAR